MSRRWDAQGFYRARARGAHARYRRVVFQSERSERERDGVRRERGERRHAQAEAMFGYRRALKAYAVFIFHVCETCEKESKDDVAMVCAQKPAPGAKGKKKQTNKNKLAEWRWDEQRERIVHVMAGALDIDLWQVFRPKQPEEDFLRLFVRLASMCLENPAALKSKVTKRSGA